MRRLRLIVRCDHAGACRRSVFQRSKPMAIIVVGVAGPAGCGKSTVARHIVDAWGGDTRPFAEPLKAMLKTFLRYQGVDAETCCRMVSGNLKEVPSEYLGGRTPREAMQTIGDWARALHPDLVVNAWRRCIDRDVEESTTNHEDYILVADDVRFPNEVGAVRCFGGSVLRPNGRAGIAASSGHASEKGGFEVDAELNNTGTVADLHKLVDGVMRYLKETPAR